MSSILHPTGDVPEAPLDDPKADAHRNAEVADAVADEAEADADAERGPPRLHLHMPVDVRNVALVVIATLLGLWFLHWARDVAVPVLLGAMISYALSPLVDRLEQGHLPRAAGAGLVVMGLLGGLGWSAWWLSDDAAALVDSLPRVAQKVRETVTGGSGAGGGITAGQTLERVQQAAAELERVAIEAAAAGSAAQASGPSPTAAAAAQRRVQAAQQAQAALQESAREPPGGARFNLRDHVWTGTLGLITFASQFLVVVFIVFFLLASGDTFRRKMVKLAGPKLSQKKITVQALDEIHAQIQTYLAVQVGVSVLTGICTWLAFWAIGLQHAEVWGIVAGVTNLIPYLGAVLVGVASTIVGIVQFNAVDMGLLVGASSFGIHLVVGNLLTPWLTGRTNSMNPFVVFVAVLLFGWLWGVVGLVLGVPILVVVKAVCDRIDELKPVAELISG